MFKVIFFLLETLVVANIQWDVVVTASRFPAKPQHAELKSCCREASSPLSLVN